jgi:hypothetical protein
VEVPGLVSSTMNRDVACHWPLGDGASP